MLLCTYCPHPNKHKYIHLSDCTANLFEKAFWVIVTILGFVFAGVILRTAITDWIDNPAGKSQIARTKIKLNQLFSEVTIATFTLPATTLPYPAVTICKKSKYDVGEYLR